MNVRELIAVLSRMDQDARVVVAGMYEGGWQDTDEDSVYCEVDGCNDVCVYIDASDV